MNIPNHTRTMKCNSNLRTNADVMADEADELDGGGRVSDGRLDDELMVDGSVGDELIDKFK